MRTALSLGAIFVALLWSMVGAAQDPLDTWVWRNPLPQGNNLNGVAYANNTFVAVGDFGTVLSSADGVTWTSRPSGRTDRLTAITYGNGTFVAVGYYDNASAGIYSGTILTSSDGVVWTKRSSSGTSDSFVSVVYGNNTFVAVGQHGTILTSTDGVTWVVRPSDMPDSFLLYGVTYGNNTFVVGSSNNTILTSPDGVTWTARPSGTSGGIYSVTYANNTFVAVGQNGVILTSPDGVTWTKKSSDNTDNLFRIASGNGTFVAVGQNGVILTSPDGTTWAKRSSGTFNKISGIAYGNNTFVAVGWGGTILTSPDGLTWAERSSGAMTQYLFGIAYGNNTFVAVGWGGTILTSSNGVTWSARASGTTNVLRSVTFGNNIFVAAGDGVILTSSDGVTWTGGSQGTASFPHRVTYTNNIIVGVGNGIFTSSDGVVWTERWSGTSENLYSVTYGNNTYVAVGISSNISVAASPMATSGAILTSSDGIKWTLQASNAPITGIAYGNNAFVAVGFGGSILTSPDGVTWTPQKPETIEHLNDVIYGNNTFVAIGYFGTILTSPDGVTWTVRPSGTRNMISGITYIDNAFIAVGQNGTILQSGPIGVYTISGSTKDTSEVPIQAASIVIKDGSSNIASTTTTDVSGNYKANLPSEGRYSVTASKAGYEMSSLPQVVILDTTHSEVSLPVTYMKLSTISFSIPLPAGWNFISTPIQPRSTNIASVLQDISQNVRIVWSYDGSAQSWQMYRPTGLQNTLATIEAGNGYWVYMSSSATLTINGVLSKTPVHLHGQWNLVGHKGTDGISTTGALSELSDKWRIIWSWDNGQWHARDSYGSELSVPALKALYRGRAYWIRAKEEIDWTNDEINFTEDDNGKEFEVGKDSIISIKLPGNPASTGFSWYFGYFNPDYFKILKQGYTPSPCELPKVGCGGVQWWELKTIKTGTETMQLLRYQPWVGEDSAANQFEITLDIR